ncbi:TM2 domain-containing protein almondex [Onthophagus taurus]|uniref:TM2 domain-containing protein almondex n=1 Tax=Onthophagus taurus TaxID=166361 RepID=UPI000C20AE1F|nr:TM2 domain-containing protein almondex [Onthophagus taurus]
MKCVHISIRNAVVILLCFLTQHSHMLDNEMDVSSTKRDVKNIPAEKIIRSREDKIIPCSSSESTPCTNLNAVCLNCNFTNSCIYGEKVNVTCMVDSYIKCSGDRTFEKTVICQYCYQTERWEHNCELKADCHSILKSKNTYQTNCTVRDDIVCLGERTFNKNVQCNWTRGYRWTTTLALSIGLGGFGADRFYLGHWQEGIGKLFSFGGFGVWTLIDVILISLHYLGPADGSLYI